MGIYRGKVVRSLIALLICYAFLLGMALVIRNKLCFPFKSNATINLRGKFNASVRITQVDVERIKKKTNFTEEEIQLILRGYSYYGVGCAPLFDIDTPGYYILYHVNQQSYACYQQFMEELKLKNKGSDGSGCSGCSSCGSCSGCSGCGGCGD